MNNTGNEWIAALQASLAQNIFVRLTMSDYRGREDELKKISVRRIVVKGEEKLSFTYSYKTRDIVKNYAHEDAVERLKLLLADFARATLFSTEFNLSYPAMQKQPPTERDVPEPSHDRSKNRQIDTAGKQYLQDLKITDANGQVLKNAQDKYRQIDKYIEILGGLIKANPHIKTVTDMGAGKGYLTFALYDYLTNKLSMDVSVTGVEYRKDLVDLCNRIAMKAGFSNLKFMQGSIADFDAGGTDLLIALHACDTATDDAIYKGIMAGSSVIVVAPCCHKQVRRDLDVAAADAALAPLLKHGTFLEREAEMATDALRALYLERAGYDTKAFEFISDAHTPKNVMITATKSPKKRDAEKILNEAAALKKLLGIKTHRLEQLLGL